MLIWSIASQKGGVGKTTTVASLAGWLQREHLRVLVIDTDPHASLTGYLGFEDEGLDYNLYDLYSAKQLSRENVLRTITHTRFPGLDIIGSTMALATIDRQLSGRVGVGRILSKSLQLVEDCYDVVLVDCPPVLGALMVNALVASTTILVPTQTEFLALKGLEGMVRTFRIMHNADPGYVSNFFIVPTMYDKRTKASQNSLEYLRAHYNTSMWADVIPVDTLFRESSQKGVPIPMMDDKCRGAQAYRQLLLALIERELRNNRDLVSPAVAAIITVDDEDGETHQKEEGDPLAESMGAMMEEQPSAGEGA
ncbi:MAG: ParA family protein [Succinivibrio sp.]|nr:ParA family protein [Succinivibrio sp.]